MLRGFWKLTWVETKVFLREPLGLLGSLGVPVILFVVLGRLLRVGQPAAGPGRLPSFNVAIFSAILIALGSVQSLVGIIAIYREGGILKRLRATPLSPLTILGAQVVVKLAFALVSLALLMLAGKRLFPGVMQVNVPSFAAALLLGTLSILSLGFVIASLVPTARFARPISSIVLTPMLAVSGLFFPVEALPPALRVVAFALPTTHAVALMQGIWAGAGWGAHGLDALALVLLFAAYTGLSTRVFRWE